ncbi:MAG: DUF3021 domain-containing protein [Lachnospiraceae bacterium]|nr:DUF3021 domain-containing protein [Lachnospiraceae bacterium]
MSFRNKVIVLCSIGFAVGVIFCVTFSAMITTMSIGDGTFYLVVPEFAEDMGGMLPAFVIDALVCGMFGVVAIGGSSVYELEEWSYLRATVTHFLMTVISYYLVGFFLRWFSFSDIKWCLLWLVIYIITYTLIWFGNYLKYRSEVRKINKELGDLRAVKQPV